MNSDFKELLQALNEANVEFLVVGGYAVVFYAQPRFTEDLDIWIKPSVENAMALMHAFRIFGMPLIDIKPSDFEIEGTQYKIGVAPSCLDFLTSVEGLNFEECWENKNSSIVEEVLINYLSKSDLIRSKTVMGRDKDRADIAQLTLAEERE